MSRKYYVETYGCQMNAYDSQVVDGVLEEAGMSKVDTPEEADLIMLNTCSVRDNAEQRVLGRIRHLHGLCRRAGNEPLLGVLGCMAQRLGPELLGRKNHLADFVVGPDQYLRLTEIIDRAEKREADLYFTDFDNLVSYKAKPRVMPPGGTHFLAAMHGCDKYCSYCIVPFTRGRERSRPLAEIVSEAEELASRGAFEITLLGQTISSYRDGTSGFTDLLEQVARIRGIKSVRFMTSYPTDLTPEVFGAMAAIPELGRAIHLPVQSGSDGVLGRMNRHYSISEYEKILAAGRKAMPDLLFSTDLIVGFPGEKEDDFEATLELIGRQRFISAFTFKYSPREGTRSSRWEDDVPTAVKESRLALLNAEQATITRNHLEERLGKTVEILLDEPSKKNETQMRGRTRCNLRVVIDPQPGMVVGSRVMARIREISGETLIGDALASVSGG